MSFSAPTSFGSLRDFVRSASDEPIPDDDEIRRLSAAAADGDSNARQRLVQLHLRLVVDETIAHRGETVRSVGLVNEGLRALGRSAVTYRPGVGEDFTRYARRAIRRSLREAFFAH